LIKNIIFDLGNVLVSVHFDKFEKRLLAEGASKAACDSLFQSRELREDYESGKMSNSEFLKLACSKLDCRISQSKFKDIFSDMFSEIPEMKSFVNNLINKKYFRLYLLSNTNSYHFNYIKNKFEYVKEIKNFALSYRMKLNKPFPGIFKKVINRYKLKPEETLFIDDLEANCKTAEKLGMKTICYTTFKKFEKEFKQIIPKGSLRDK
jgi:epoxide hydrolase-like predicted phosphatase